MDSSIALAPVARILLPSRLSPPDAAVPAPGPKFDRYLDGVRGAERRSRFEPPVSAGSDDIEEATVHDSDDSGEAPEFHAESEDSVDVPTPLAPTTAGTLPTPVVDIAKPAVTVSAGSTPGEAADVVNRAQDAQRAEPLAGTPVDIQLGTPPDGATAKKPKPVDNGQTGQSTSRQTPAPSGEPVAVEKPALDIDVKPLDRELRPLPPEETSLRPEGFRNRGAARYASNPTADAVRPSDRPVPPGQSNQQKSEVAQQVAPQKFVATASTPHKLNRGAADHRAQSDRSTESPADRNVAADPRIKGLADGGDSGRSPSFDSRGNPPEHAIVARPHITGGQGDGTAASIARFLLTPSSESGTQPVAIADMNPTAAGGTASISTNPGGQSASPTTIVATDASATVSDLLTPSGSTEPIDHAARILSTSLRGGRHSAVLTLDPPELGRLRLDVHMHKDVMTLRATAETQAVARLIESRITELRDALAQHGIHIDRSQVTVRAAPAADLGGHSTANSDGQPWSATADGNDLSHGASTADAEANEFAAPDDGGAGQAPQDAEGPVDAVADDAVAEDGSSDSTLTGASAQFEAESPREWVNLVA
jgi:flagellar hook-length control protein FliK